MRIVLLAGLVFSLLITSGLAQTVFFFPQVGDGTAGNIRFQTTLIFVNTGIDGQATVEFFKFFKPSQTQLEGMPLTLISEGQPMGPASVFTIPLAQGQAFSAQTPGTGELQVGYAKVTAGSGIGGTAVFTRSDLVTGTILYEAGVSASPTLPSFSLFLDSLGNKDTGLALVNPPNAVADASLTLTLYDKFFTQIATTSLVLEVGQHFPKFINEIFSDVKAQAQEMEGVVGVQGDQPVAAVTLRQNDDPTKVFPEEVPTLTTFPVVPGTAVSSSSSGSFSLLSSGEVSTSLDLSFESRTVIGVIYRLYDGELALREVTRGIVSLDGMNHVLPAVRAGHRVSRVEAQLIYAGGHLGAGFDLLPN